MGAISSDPDRQSLFEACAREAERLGGDINTTEYFFERAMSSRVWVSRHGEVTVADMDIADWCGAIVWSAPGIGPIPKRAKPKLGLPTSDSESESESESESDSESKEIPTSADERKEPRSGARSRRTP